MSRKWIQSLFCAIVIFIGIKFYYFVFLLEQGLLPEFERPPGVEAFLPISALVSLKHLVLTGIINGIHPSGLVLFLIICLTALIAKKGFCAWVCPMGILSEFLAALHLRIFKKGLTLPAWTDFVLRSLKYIIAGFFMGIIFFRMPGASIEQFIHSPYNRFADIQMLRFFTHISHTALIVILVLLFLSLVVRHFWCRYLCPYGAILGILGILSLGKIQRTAANCIQCGRCERGCPSAIKITQKHQIQSLECTACMTCVNNCPGKNVLGFSFFSGKLPVKEPMLALIMILVFATGISLAKLSGNWQNKISKEAYLGHVIQRNLSWSGKGEMDPQKMEKMIQMMKNLQSQRPHRFPPVQEKGDPK